MIIIFQVVQVPSLIELCREFKRRYVAAQQRDGTPSHLLENSEMLWISEPDLRKMCTPGHLHEVMMPPELYGMLYPFAYAFEERKVEGPIFPPSRNYPPLYSAVRSLLMPAFRECADILIHGAAKT